MRYVLGYRSITKDDIIKILKEEGIATANTVATKLNKHFYTAQRRLEELVDDGTVIKNQYKPKTNIIRLYKLSDKYELEHDTSEAE